MDEFEQELRQALERRPAPPGLKRKVMERRNARGARSSAWGLLLFRIPAPKTTGEMGRQRIWLRAAATVVLAAMLGGGVRWGMEKREELRRGEEARQQVLTALRITGHALNQMQARLAAHGRSAEQ